MQKDQLLNAIHTAGLARLTPHLTPLMADSIRIQTQSVAESALSLGASRIGGRPDLPDTLAWPQWNSLPMSFIAQFALSEVSPYDTSRLLPSSGGLYFFYDAAQETYGGNANERDAWKVLYNSSPATVLRRREFPPALPATSRFAACALTFNVESTLPQRPEVLTDNLDWTDAEQRLYAEFMAAHYPDRTPTHHRLLGHSDDLQDDMHLQAQLAAHGLNPEQGDTSPELEPGARDWLLLLQLDSDHNAGMRWGSAGMLYFWIQRLALQNRSFDNVWLVLQSD